MVSLCLGASENPVWSHVGRTVVVAAPADVEVDERELEVTVTVEAVVTVVVTFATVAWEETCWSESLQAAPDSSTIAITSAEVAVAANERPRVR
jgi:hypothetical protein